VRITSDHGTLTGLAARTSPCAACGITLYREQAFAGVIVPAQPDGVRVALAELLERVRRWRQEPIRCKRCPERVALEPSP
jgi:hypothetical protein